MGYSMFAPTGVTHNDAKKSLGGYTLFTTLSGNQTYLIDMAGEVVRAWRPPEPWKPYYGYFLENGNLLLRCTTGRESWGFGGASGAVVELDWDGQVVWQFEHPTLHHDHCRLRNGNTLVLAWEILDPASLLVFRVVYRTASSLRECLMRTSAGFRTWQRRPVLSARPAQ